MTRFMVIRIMKKVKLFARAFLTIVNVLVQCTVFTIHIACTICGGKAICNKLVCREIFQLKRHLQG